VVGACSTHRKIRSSCNVLLRKPERRRPLEDLGVDGSVILKGI